MEVIPQVSIKISFFIILLYLITVFYIYSILFKFLYYILVLLQDIFNSVEILKIFLISKGVPESALANLEGKDIF